MVSLNGKTALVTGARTGIGFGIATALVERGANVVITSRSEDKLRTAAAELGDDRALGIAGDAHDPEHQRAAVAAAIERFGSLDLLVNNVGGTERDGRRLVDTDVAAYRRTIDLNLTTALTWVQAAWHGWLGEHGGAIVNISSIASKLAVPDGTSYGTAKAAVNHFTRQMANELAPGVRVNCVEAGTVLTDFTRPNVEGREEKVVGSVPLKRIGKPADVGAAVAFLLSDDASWVTGHTLVVDGGRLLHNR
ncbi:SDR family oxidoreductase [Micromonospora sp. HM134]|uniref:SDR family oxidoreductase n=1 Tax=Micromonospora sp. S-DT3-3-22 TaxID=2755359 RepID=UPI00119899CF|nr:SDR family oxidoreductase [Micromonospora sp. S-DT3-3-22]QDY06412.1 SDR family oxidoreductase [Micromonospora sp. HM134]